MYLVQLCYTFMCVCVGGGGVIHYVLGESAYDTLYLPVGPTWGFLTQYG